MKKIILLFLFLYITYEKESNKYSCQIYVEAKDSEDCFSRKVYGDKGEKCCYFEVLVNDAFTRKICYEIPKEYEHKPTFELIYYAKPYIKNEFFRVIGVDELKFFWAECNNSFIKIGLSLLLFTFLF